MAILFAFVESSHALRVISAGVRLVSAVVVDALLRSEETQSSSSLWFDRKTSVLLGALGSVNRSLASFRGKAKSPA